MLLCFDAGAVLVKLGLGVDLDWGAGDSRRWRLAPPTADSQHLPQLGWLARLRDPCKCRRLPKSGSRRVRMTKTRTQTQGNFRLRPPLRERRWRVAQRLRCRQPPASETVATVALAAAHSGSQPDRLPARQQDATGPLCANVCYE